MEWFILFVIVPAILVPVVLLCGFAGCGTPLEVDQDTSVPLAPTNMHALVSETAKEIVLIWVNKDADPARFEVERTEQTLAPTKPVLLPDMITATAFVDKTAPAGLTFKYRVRVYNSVGAVSLFSDESSATMYPAPQALTATAKDVDQIDVTWPAPALVRVEHRSPPGAGAFVKVYEGPTPFEHKGLTPNSPHEYQGKTYVDGVSDSMPRRVPTDPSAPVQATTRKWDSYLSTSGAPLNPAGGLNLNGACVVQRITGVMLAQPKQSIRISLKGVAGQTTTLTNVCISNALAATSVQPWDAADQPIDVTFAGKKGVTLVNDQVVASDKIRFTVVPGKDLLFAFDVIMPTPNAPQLVQRRTVAGMTAYVKLSAAEASSQDRSQGYNVVNNVVHCIESIEVA